MSQDSFDYRDDVHSATWWVTIVGYAQYNFSTEIIVKKYDFPDAVSRDEASRQIKREEPENRFDRSFGRMVFSQYKEDIIREIRERFPDALSICNECNGTGRRPRSICKHCSGQGYAVTIKYI